jgi:hypothetical protein
VIGWTYIKGHSDQQDLTSSLQVLGYPVQALKVEERIVLYTSADTLIVAKAAVSPQAFTKLHNLLLSLFEVDLDVEKSNENYRDFYPPEGFDPESFSL